MLFFFYTYTFIVVISPYTFCRCLCADSKYNWWTHKQFVTRWLQREVNQLRAQAPMSQFCSLSGFRFRLHSSSSSTSPWLLRHTTSLLRWPTPHGTEHWATQGGREGGTERSMGVFIIKMYMFIVLNNNVNLLHFRNNSCIISEDKLCYMCLSECLLALKCMAYILLTKQVSYTNLMVLVIDRGK